MATDDHGLGIPVPDENTQDYEFYALIRDAINTLAGVLVKLRAEVMAIPAPPTTDNRVDDLVKAVAALSADVAAIPVPSSAPAPDTRVENLQLSVLELTYQLNEIKEGAS